MIDRRAAYGGCGDCALSPQHHEQVAQRGAAVVPIALNRFDTSAARKMLDDEIGEGRLGDVPKVLAAQALSMRNCLSAWP